MWLSACVCVCVCITDHKASKTSSPSEGVPLTLPPLCLYLSVPLAIKTPEAETVSTWHRLVCRGRFDQSAAEFALKCQPRCVNRQPLTMTGSCTSVYSISWADVISSRAIWSELPPTGPRLWRKMNHQRGLGKVSSLLAQMWQSNLLTGLHMKLPYQSYQWGLYQGASIKDERIMYLICYI